MHPLARLSFLLLLLLADVALGQTNEPQFRKPVNCANLQNGNYVWGCSRYYSVCTNGRELPMQCYTSLKLNPDNNQCDSPASIAVCADTGDTNKLFRSKDPFTCDGQEDGNYEAGPCSNFYIQCSQGRRFDQTCPNGLVFNRQASVCDFASKCKKAGRRVPKKMTARIAYAQPLQPVLEDSFSDPVSPVAPQSPQQPYYSQQQPAANNVEQDSPAVQADAPFDCVGKSDGVYLSHGTACTDNFWKCANGQAFAYNCTKGLAYNVANDQCDYPHFVIACGGTPPDPTSTPAPAPPLNVPPFVCTGRADGLYTDRNCASNYFYSCQGGGSTAMQCTPGLVFDSLSNLCDFPRTCGKPKPPLQQQDPVRTNLEHGTSNYYFGGNKRYTNVAYPQYLPSGGSSPNQPQGVPGATAEQPQPPSPSSSSPPGFQCAGKKDGYYVRTPCTPQFFSCSNGVASPVTCPGELVFDAQQAQCEFPSACGQPASGPSSPAAPSNPALPPASSPGEQFPPPPQVPSAAVPIPVPQPPQLVPPPPSTGFNCAGKRNGYYVRQPCTPEFFSCSNGVSTNATCPGGLVFDVQRAQCEFQAACGQQQPTSPEQPGQIPPPAEVPTTIPSAGGQPPQIDCINRRDGYYYKQACRSQFVICASGTSIQQSCPAGTVFEPRTGQCQYPAQCGQAQQSSTGPGQSSSSPVPSPQQTAPAAGRPTGGQDVVDVPTVPPVNQIPPGIAFSCAGRPNGYYIQQPCQQRFVSCSGGQMRRQSCPDGLVFDPNNAQCEFAAVCGKSDNTGQPPSTPPEQPSSPPSVAVQIPSSPTECEQRTKLVSEPNPEPAPAQSTVVPVPQPSAPQSPQAVPGQPGFSCVGKKDGHYMRQQCQPSYTVCSGGAAVRRRCPDGLVFDADTAQCEFRSQCGQQSGTSSQGIVPAAAAQQVPPSVNQPSTVQTPQQQLPVAPPAFPPPAQSAPEQPLPPSAAGFKCTGRIDGYYYRKACTSHFYTCVGGHATQLTCPGNLVFDPTKALCQYPQVCGRPSQPDENGVDTSVPQPQPPQVDFNCQGKRNGYYVKRGCTSQFYTCLGGMATKLSCPASLVFDPQSASCQYPNICQAGQPQQPPASSSGNQEDTDDVPPANPAAAAPQPPSPQQQVQPPVPQPQPSNSNNFDCSNKANGAYAMGNCVNSYTLCSNSVAHLLQCPGELLFSPASNNTCDYRSACQSGPPQQPPAEQPLPATTPNNAGGPVPSSSSSQQIPAPQQPSPVASQQQIPNVPAPEQPQPAPGSQRGNQQTTQQLGVQGQALPPRQRNKPSPVVQPQRSAVCGQSAEGLHAQGCNEKFYACTAGSSTQMDCPTGLFFDADTQRCDLKEVIVACGGQKKNETQQSEEGPARKPGTRQPAIPGSSSNPKLPVVPVAPEFDCSNKAIGYYSVGCTSRYHSCTGINSYSFDCPSGLKYDQEAAQCDYEANVPACGGSRPTTPRPVAPPAQSGNSQTQGPQTVAGSGDQPSPQAAPIQSGMHPQQPASNPCGELPDGAYGPACSAYYFICSNGMPFDYVCGGGLIYDMTTKQCLPAQQMPSCPQQ